MSFRKVAASILASTIIGVTVGLVTSIGIVWSIAISAGTLIGALAGLTLYPKVKDPVIEWWLGLAFSMNWLSHRTWWGAVNRI